MHQSFVDAGRFRLWLVFNQAYASQTPTEQQTSFASSDANPSKTLVVLLEGDGAPWIEHRWIAFDPTPDDPLILPLLTQLTTPAVYLGRPCYFRAQLKLLSAGEVNQCSPEWWTDARYSEPVVASLTEAVQHLSRGYARVLLVGHSGGGCLAVLIAPRLPPNVQVDVMTWAGNLNVTEWTHQHDYAELSQSLDPARQPPLPVRIRQRHLVGVWDRNILPEWVRTYAENQPNAEFQIMQGFDHRCCWRGQGKGLIEDFLTQLDKK